MKNKPRQNEEKLDIKIYNPKNEMNLEYNEEFPLMSQALATDFHEVSEYFSGVDKELKNSFDAIKNDNNVDKLAELYQVFEKQIDKSYREKGKVGLEFREERDYIKYIALCALESRTKNNPSKTELAHNNVLAAFKALGGVSDEKLPDNFQPMSNIGVRTWAELVGDSFRAVKVLFSKIINKISAITRESEPNKDEVKKMEEATYNVLKETGYYKADNLLKMDNKSINSIISVFPQDRLKEVLTAMNQDQKFALLKKLEKTPAYNSVTEELFGKAPFPSNPALQNVIIDPKVSNNMIHQAHLLQQRQEESSGKGI
jgi:hypothetical protein